MSVLALLPGVLAAASSSGSDCSVASLLGCFDDTACPTGCAHPLLPRYQVQLHDKVTLGACASACAGLRLAVAGIDGGNHCFCGSAADLAAAAAGSHSRPQAECQSAPCHAAPAEKCGGTGRLLAYNFSCSPGPRPPTPTPPPPPPPPPTPTPTPPPPPVPPRKGKRSVMIWFLGSCPDGLLCNATGWARRIAAMKAHSDNFTAVSPPLYNIAADGSFARIGGDAAGSYAVLFPHMRELAALGLEVHPLIAGPPNMGGQAALIRNPTRYIDAAVAEAVRNNWTGYNFDNELRGKFTEGSWAFLRGQGAPWVHFIDQFAEAMHAVNKTLSVDIEGCCGWVDTPRPLAPVGRCGGRSSVPWVGVFGAHEFLDATCPEYYASKVDWVYAMASYGTTINGPTEQPRGKYNYSCECSHARSVVLFAGAGYACALN